MKEDDLSRELADLEAYFKANLKASRIKEQQQILQNQFIQGLVLKNIPVSFARRCKVESIEQLQQVIAEAEKEYLKNN